MNKQYFCPDEIREEIRFACHANGIPELAKKIRFSFNNRFTRRMGDANYYSNRIRLSKPLWKRATPEQRRETIIHEACHLIARHKHGPQIKAHGREWKAAMRRAGFKPIRCHSVDTSGLREGTQNAFCMDCKKRYILGKTRIKRHIRAIQQGRPGYVCKCGGTLRFPEAIKS